ncbi:MAG: hypothetical protein A2Z28_04025 [Chloroflexi bacterium RBG_16_51_9]|nr:MAG: hypothetical protein A2Z28_04025 [Chloroflexi bacterium RBG_16_51_9]
MKTAYITKQINRVNSEFVKETRNFLYEADFQCLLFQFLRESPEEARVQLKIDGSTKTVDLVHAEFPSPVSPRKPFDIAIMEKKSANTFYNQYGESERDRAPNLFLTAAIEIKFLYFSPKKETVDGIEYDIKKLGELLNPKILKGKYGYFLLYVDYDKEWIITNGKTVNIWSRGNWNKIYQIFKKASIRCEGLAICCILGKQNCQYWFLNGKEKGWEIVDNSLD